MPITDLIEMSPQEAVATERTRVPLRTALEGLKFFAPALASFLQDFVARISSLESTLRDQIEEVRLLTREQAARVLACSTDQVDRWIASGQLGAIQLDRRPRVSLKEAKRFIEARKRTLGH